MRCTETTLLLIVLFRMAGRCSQPVDLCVRIRGYACVQQMCARIIAVGR